MQRYHFEQLRAEIRVMQKMDHDNIIKYVTYTCVRACVLVLNCVCVCMFICVSLYLFESQSVFPLAICIVALLFYSAAP